MPIQVRCPECRTLLRVANTAQVKKICCSHCKSVFPVGSPAINDNGSSAITPTVAKTKAAGPSIARKEARWSEAEDDEDRPIKKKKNSILPYLLIGGGLLLFLMCGGGSIGVYFVWKAIVDSEEQSAQLQKAQEQKVEEQKRLAEEAHQRIQAEFERAQAEHNRVMEAAQRRIADNFKEVEQQRLERQRQIEADIQEHHRRIQKQFEKIGPNNLPGGILNPLEPPPKQQIVQSASRSIALESKLHQIFGILWLGTDVKKAAIVNLTDSAMRVDQYDLANGRKLNSMDTPFQSIAATIRDVSPDGTYYICDNHSFLSIWAMPNPKPIVEKWQPPPFERKTARSADNKVVAAYLLNERRLLTVNGAGQVGVWSIPKATEDKPSLQKSYVPEEKVARYPSALVEQCIAISPDRERLAVFNGSDGFLLLDTATLQLQGVLTSAEDALAANASMRDIYGVAFSPDGKQLAAVLRAHASRPGARPNSPQIVRWDVKTQQRTARFDDPSKGSGGVQRRVGWWGNDFVWVAYSHNPCSLVSWTTQRVVIRAALGFDEKIYFGNNDGKCWFLVGDPSGNSVLKSIDLPVEALKRADQPLQLTRDGIFR